MATWYDVIDRFIAHPKLKNSFKLQGLFNEHRDIDISKARKALTARHLYGEWIDLGQKLDIPDIESRRQNSKANKLLANAVELQAQRRIGQWLIENPPGHGRPTENVRTADNYSRLPKWLDRRDANRYRKLAQIPKRDWYNHLCRGIDDGSLSLRSAWDLGDECVQKRNTAKINRLWDTAANELEKARKTAKKGTVAAEKVKWAGDGDWFRLYCCDFIRVRLEKRANHIVSDPPYRRSDLDKQLFVKLSEWAWDNIKPNGNFALLVGWAWMPEIIQQILTKPWQFRWGFIQEYERGGWPRVTFRRVLSNTKIVLVFKKSGSALLKGKIAEGCILHAGGRVKKWHDWQQDVETFEQLIDKLTDPNELICDPCAGTGTTGIAAMNLKRKFVGVEKEEKVWKAARGRLWQCLKKKNTFRNSLPQCKTCKQILNRHNIYKSWDSVRG